MGATKSQINKQNKIREKTNQELLQLLMTYHMANLIRPTGYGKTYHISSLVALFPNKNFLYLYPSEVVANAAKNSIITHAKITDPDVVETINSMSKFMNVTMMTYAMFSRQTPAEIKKIKADVVIADESHLLGGQHIKQNFHILKRSLKDAWFIGATATPMRMDGFDVTKVFFKNKKCFSYTIHDAIRDRMYPKPVVIYGVYNEATNDDELDAYIREEAFLGGQFGKKDIIESVIKKKFIEWCQINDIDKIFKRGCVKHIPNTEYMKWIVFFSSIAHITEKLPRIKEYWQKAFPNHNIRVTIIHSGNKVTRENQKKLNTIKKAHNTIDLIACVNMLNVGYHVSDLNGIIMYRATKSDTIYIQQMGRCLTFGSKIKPVIFDIVDNLHRSPLFETTDENGNHVGKPNKGRKRKANKPIRCYTGLMVDKNNNVVIITPTGIEPTDYTIDENNRIWIDDELTDFEIDTNTRKIYTYGDNDNTNIFTSGDIDPSTVTVDNTGKTATYKEFIARLAMTEKYQATKLAIYAFTFKYCMKEHIKFPINNKKWNELLAKQDKDFINGFKECFTKNGIAYPFQNKQMLIKWGLDTSTPAQWFAQHYNTTIGMMCEMLGIK